MNLATRNFLLILFFCVFCVYAPSSLSKNKVKALKQSDVVSTTEKILQVLDQHYVYPNIAVTMRKQIEDNAAQGSYKSVTSNKELIKKLQIDLRKVSRDNHISLHLAHEPNDRTSHISTTTASQKSVELSIISTKSSTANVSYLRFNKFTDQIKTELKKVMSELDQDSPLIIDLRDNGGGDPYMVTFLASYFLDSGTHLWSLLDRNGDTVFSATSQATQQRHLGKLCILTSNKTYSAAEAFAYTLKHLGRACIVGEPSGGGAHLVEMQQVNEHIDIRIPVLRAYNKITEKNWETVGVTPDIDTKLSDAKSVAVDFLRNSNRSK